MKCKSIRGSHGPDGLSTYRTEFEASFPALVNPREWSVKWTRGSAPIAGRLSLRAVRTRLLTGRHDLNSTLSINFVHCVAGMLG